MSKDCSPSESASAAPHLAGDFFRREISLHSLAARLAERAFYGAANLRRNADSPLPVIRECQTLHRSAIRQLKQVLRSTVRRELLLDGDHARFSAIAIEIIGLASNLAAGRAGRLDTPHSQRLIQGSIAQNLGVRMNRIVEERL